MSKHTPGLRAALERIVGNDSCLCDCFTLRNYRASQKSWHAEECPYRIAQEALIVPPIEKATR